MHKPKHWFLSLILVLLVAILGLLAVRSLTDSDLGIRDFKAYWAASRLLLEGRNPCSASNLFLVQKQILPELQEPMMAWNPPTLWVFLLPLAWMPFSVARALWLLTNFVMAYISCQLLIQIFVPGSSRRIKALFILIGCVFTPVLTAIQVGQVALIVLLGLVAAIYLIEKERWFYTGVMLSLTSIKPHLVFLSVPYLIIYSIRKREWGLLAGLSAVGGLCAIVLFALRPLWIQDYLAFFETPPSNYLTPTLGGIIGLMGLPGWLRYLGLGSLLILPAVLRNPRHHTLGSTIGLLTLITIPTSFYGWSFDQSLLLIPIAEIYTRLIRTRQHAAKTVLSVAFGAALIANVILGIAPRNHVFFIWVPLVWVVIYIASGVLLKPGKETTGAELI